MEYTIRQSVANWIQRIINNKPGYQNFANTVNNTVAIIKQNDNQKISLQEIDRAAINAVIGTDIGLVDIKLSQLEPNPGNLSYTTKPLNPTLVNYLYDINYVPSTTDATNQKCYQTNPEIVKKLLSADTINSKNSDGNTALHYAVRLNDPDITKLLISRGAFPMTSKNIYGKTPFDILLENLQKHITYTKSSMVYGSIKNLQCHLMICW